MSQEDVDRGMAGNNYYYHWWNSFYCPDGFSLSVPSEHEYPVTPDGTYYAYPCYRLDSDTADGDGKNAGPPEVCDATNPIHTGWHGNKYQVEIDYVGDGPFPLQFARHYNSRDPQISGLVDGGASSVVGRWRHTYERSLVFYSNGSKAAWYRPDGKIIVFRSSGADWVADANVVERLYPVSGGFWNVVGGDDSVETYDSTGKLMSIKNRDGLTQTLAYSNGQLSSVSDPFGRTLTFTYSGDKVSTLTDPAGGIFSYGYSADGNLVSVTYPDASVRTYRYDDSAFPKALTGIIDENNSRFTTWVYDAQGRAISSEHGATGSGINLATVTYNGENSATVTDALGASRDYAYSKQLGVVKNTGVSEPCPSCGGSNASNTTYDANGNVASRTDFNGNVTQYTYDLARNLEISRTEAYGTSLARTFSTQWHADFRLPVRIDEPGRSTELEYDARGNLALRRITDTATGVFREWSYSRSYSGSVSGAVTQLVVDGPRTDVSDLTTYDYDAQGNLVAVTNALGHVTHMASHDAHGRPLSITDPNGLVTELSYSPRGWLLTSQVGSELTQYEYDDAGQVVKVTLPNGAYLAYTYDAAHRLTDIQDQLGNRIHYTLDALGNSTGQDTYDPSGVLVQTHSRVFNDLNQLYQNIGGAQAGEVTTYEYDGNSNLVGIVNPLNHAARQDYDALNRPWRATDPLQGVTERGYNALDHLTSVTDPRGLTTGYEVNAFGETIRITSPDAGVVVLTYDQAGNLLTHTDAKGEVTTYQYDALNRLTSRRFADGSVHTFTYDLGAGQIGQLSQMTDESGTTAYTYDLHGRMTRKVQTTGSVSLTTRYAYDASGQLTTMTYPTGVQAVYTWTNGRITLVRRGGSTVASGIQYFPLGGVSAWTFGNGQTVTRGFDLDGRLTSHSLGTLDYDNAGRIVSQNTLLGDRSYDYDALGRLTSYVHAAGWTNYVYDGNGNRTQHSDLSGYTDYSFDVYSNRLLAVGGGAQYTYDDNGSSLGSGSAAAPAAVTTWEAEAIAQLSASDAVTVFSEAAASGGAARRLNANAAGDYVSFTLPNVPAGTYTVRVKAKKYSSRGSYQLAIDGAAQGQPQNLYAPTSQWYEADLGSVTFSAAGDRTFTFTVVGKDAASSGYDLAIDAITLTGAAADGVVSWEAEAVSGLVASDSVALFSDVAASGGVAQKLNANAVNDFISYTLPDVPAGTYTVRVRSRKYTTRGRYQLSIDGAAQGQPQNLYASSSSWYEADLGSVTFNAAGDRVFTFTVVGKDTASSGYDLTFDAITLSQAAPPYQYNAAGRLSQAGGATYVYNALGERVKKILADGSVYLFVYDEAHKLIGEYGASGNRIQETTYLGNLPLAVAIQSSLYFIHTDHLNTPRRIYDANRTLVWQWDSDPFGLGAADTDPDGDQVTLVYNLRFPGQYYDAETGLHYNLFRDYDPATGRYLQSDPIGLAGGINVYGYANGNPVTFTDPLGLEATMSGADRSALCAAGSVMCGYYAPGDMANPMYSGRAEPVIFEDLLLGAGGGAARACGVKAYARNNPFDADALRAIEVNGTSAKRIRVGTNGKIAIIGRSMHGKGGVVDYTQELNRRGYRTHLFAGDEISAASRHEWDYLKEVFGDAHGIIPQNKLIGTIGYRENKAWAQKMVDEGYTVIDIGNPNNQGFSVYYAIEKKIIFGSGNAR